MRLFADLWPFGDLPPHSFDFIMADPPWQFVVRSEKGEGKSAQKHYRTMPIEQINALPVLDLAAENCTLWLWCTAPMLPQQIQTAAAWGFTYCTEGVWVKMTKHGKVAFGTGYGLRGSHEPFIIAKRGEPKLTRSTRSVIHGKVREHSQKPEEAFAEAERLMPRARRLELFSRTDRKGWTSWGDETGKLNEVAAMNPHQIEQFEQFWKSYPRRIGKGAARKAFEKALKLTSFEDIMTGLHRQIPYYQSREQQFIPHPTTWLNQERWADDPQPTRERQRGNMADFGREVMEKYYERTDALPTTSH